MDAYIYRADIYCEDCAEQTVAAIRHDLVLHTNLIGSDNFPQGPFPNGGGEADIPQHCGSCGVFLENPLTEIGRNYAQLACDWNTSTKHTVALAIWADFYDITPNRPPLP